MSDQVSDSVRNAVINMIVEGSDSPTNETEKRAGVVNNNNEYSKTVEKKVIKETSPTPSWSNILEETLKDRDVDSEEDEALNERRNEVIDQCDLNLITELF